jgi:signal transduction histidine kinase
MLRSPATWRQAGYHLLAAPALAVAAATAFAMWLAGVLYALVYAYAWTLPGQALLSRGQSSGPPGHLPPMSNIPMDVYLTVGGLALLMAAPWLTAGFAALDVRAAQALLGPSRAEELEHRVERLTQTRAGVVDAADAERRRLERNLHDGTQQRLVSLAMNLGMARERFDGESEPVRLAIAAAHDEAVLALTELREFIRGLHPAVLSDRGLVAALSGLAARAPLPVRLRVDVPKPAAPGVEAVAYFIVSEAIANVVKHAQATRAEVTVTRSGDLLSITVTDDGRGGATPAAGDGTGLRGLAQRAAAVDGTLSIDSPPGGPTIITAELPCES